MGVSLARFSQNLQSLYPISGALTVKIWLDLLEGLWSYGGFKLRGPGYPQIFSAPYRRNYASDSQEVQERARGPLSPCQVWWGLDYTRRLSFLYRQHCVQRKPPVINLLRGRFCTDGMEFGTEEGPRNLTRREELWSPPPCQISHPSVQRQGCKTPKTEIFTQI